MSTKQERIDVLCRPENFKANIIHSVLDQTKMLSNEERVRLQIKLRLVEKVAERMAVNMLKGTLKYDNDEYTLREWLEMGIDDGLDTVNYLALGLEKLDELEESMGGTIENSDLFATAKRADGSGV